VEKIKVGVVGVGYFGQFHAEKYAGMEEVELVGVVDVDSARAREIAQKHRTRPFCYSSDLFGKVHAVSIAVPTPLHYSTAREFLLQGVHVLLEKPIAGTLQESNELIELAETKGLVLQVGHLERFNGALQALNGLLQNPFFIESHRMSPFPGRETDINVVLDLMVHDIDIILTLVNSEVKQIHAVGIPVLTRHIDMANARIVFENGCTANLTVSRVSAEKVRRTRIFQPDGTLSIDYVSQTVIFSRKMVPAEKEGLPEMVTEEIPVRKVDLLEAEIDSFLRSIKNRKRARVSGWDGTRALEVALQIVDRIENKEG
jgi:predicted dehydrogenase